MRVILDNNFGSTFKTWSKNNKHAKVEKVPTTKTHVPNTTIVTIINALCYA